MQGIVFPKKRRMKELSISYVSATFPLFLGQNESLVPDGQLV